MFKVIEAIVEFTYWLRIFAAPFLIGVIAVVILELNQVHILALNGIILAIAAIGGIILAEFIRRKHGCSTFLSSLMSTKDIPGHSDKEH